MPIDRERSPLLVTPLAVLRRWSTQDVKFGMDRCPVGTSRLVVASMHSEGAHAGGSQLMSSAGRGDVLVVSRVLAVLSRWGCSR